jgi:hypothetical protein
MPTSASTKHRHPSKRNAKPKRPPPRHRNAGPTAPASRATVAKSKEPPPPTKKEAFVQLVETLIGAGVTSVVGAYAVKWGLHPELVSAGLGVAGGYAAWQSPKDLTRHVAAGAASAAGSQLALMWLNPGPAAPKAAPTQAAPAQIAATQPAPVPGRHADLGSLPPGMLDAAFERARSELAVAGDGYPHGYEHDHYPNHHGPLR